MKFPWWRVLNLLLDLLRELLTGYSDDEVAKRADMERAAAKQKEKNGGKG